MLNFFKEFAGLYEPSYYTLTATHLRQLKHRAKMLKVTYDLRGLRILYFYYAWKSVTFRYGRIQICSG